MNKTKAFAQAIAKTFKKQWPKMAVGAGAGLLFVGGYLLGTGIPKYKKAVEKMEEEKGEKLTTGEKAKTAARYFAGPAGAIIVGTGLVISGTRENDKRIAVSATAAALSEVASKNLATDISTYTEAAKEVVGEEKEKEIREKAQQKKIEKAPVVQLNCPDDHYLCYEKIFGSEPFVTTYNDLVTIERKAERRLHRKGHGSAITLNEIFEEAGHKPIESGEAFGWIYDDDPRHREVNLNIGSAIEDGKVILTIKPNVVIIDKSYFGITDFDY